MKVTVTPIDHHYDEDGRLGYTDQGEPFVGTTLTATPSYVEVDGRPVLVYTPGRFLGTTVDHPWSAYRDLTELPGWTGFTVEVEA